MSEKLKIFVCAGKEVKSQNSIYIPLACHP